MILPEDTKIGPPASGEEWADEGQVQNPSQFPSRALVRAPSAWDTMENSAGGPSIDRSRASIMPISGYTRMAEQYGTTRLDALDSDEEDEDGIGEELPRYTRRGTRTSRAVADNAMAGEDDERGRDRVQHPWRRAWVMYLGSNGKDSVQRRRLAVRRIGAVVILASLFGYVFYSALPRSKNGPPPWRDRRMNHAPHPIPVDTDGDVFYCTDLEQGDTVFKDNEHRSLNTTFYLPSDLALSFLHVNGPFSIGNVVISSYTPSADDLEVASATLEATVADPIRIIVESIYRSEASWQNDDLASDSDLPIRRKIAEGDEAGQEDVMNDGWADLNETSICVMRKTLNETESGRWSDDYSRDGPHGPQDRKRGLFDWWGKADRPARIAMGLGIYTRTTENRVASVMDYQNTSIQDPTVAFSVQYQIPTSTVPQHLRALDINSIMMNYLMRDTAEAVTFGTVQLHSSLGHIVVDGVSTQHLEAQTSGKISLRANISRSLAIAATQGEIDATIGVAYLTDNSGVRTVEDDACIAPPVDIMTKMGSGNTLLSFEDWNQPCRALHVDASAQVGDISVHQHPFFQGSFKMSTELGDLTLQWLNDGAVFDPLSLGRHRQYNSSRSSPIGAKHVSGSATWVDEQGLAAGPQSKSPSYMRLQSTLGSIRLDT